MKVLVLSLLALILTFNTQHAEAQSEDAASEEIVYSYKKGKIVDFLFAIQNPEGNEVLKEYFSAAIPIALKMGYQPLTGFVIPKNPTQGNFHPQYIAMGYWESWDQRTQTLKAIEAELPEFHQMRRDIWSTLNIANYEMKQDTSFVYSEDNVYALTAYWQNDETPFAKFKKEWLKKAERAGGQVHMELEGARSPFGYHYKPDYMVLTEWKSQAAFDAFYKENLAMDHRSVQHVNQFFLEPQIRGKK